MTANDLTALLFALKRALDNATGRIDTQLDEVSHVAAAIEDILAEVEGLLAAAGLVDFPVGAAVRRRQRLAAHERILDDEGRAGAASLTMSWVADGSAIVCVNGSAPFRLQCKLAALLRLIAAPRGDEPPDGLIGWRSSSEIAEALSKATGHAVTRRNLTQTTYKLRAAFRDAGQNWFFVQTDRRGGMRFAVRADAVDTTGKRCDEA